MATDRPGVSASPGRVWAATLAVLRANGYPVPAGIRWEYLPWDQPAGPDGEQVDGVAYPSRLLATVNPFKAAGDGRDLPLIMAHEVLHLISFRVERREVDDRAEEAVVEAIARTLYHPIRHRLRLDTLRLEGPPAYQAQVNPFERGTFRACRVSMGAKAKASAVERCARHTRRAFLLMGQADRANALAVWGVRLPAIPPRDAVHEWVEALP